MSDVSQSLTLLTRKNIKQFEAERDKHLKAIADATGGIQFTIDVNWSTFADACKAKGIENRVGEAIYKVYMEPLAKHIVQLCTDEMGKEAFVEAAGTKKTIRFTFVDEAEMDKDPYVVTKLIDGVVTVCFSSKDNAKNFFCGVEWTGSDIESRL